jgi:protocatechuate 3,4-dioxygenase beta subunit
MNRRQWLTMLAAAAAVWRWPRHMHAQGNAYTQAVQAAFNDFGGTKSSKGRIAPASEPGTPLLIRGTLFKADGQAPLAGALVFAYHTDQKGFYNETRAPQAWRLKGAVRTAPDGTFEFQTIRPASYPDTGIPQHVHVELLTEDGRFHAGEWRFADDPLVDAQERGDSKNAGRFGWVCPVRANGAGSEIDVLVRVNPAQQF